MLGTLVQFLARYLRHLDVGTQGTIVPAQMVSGEMYIYRPYTYAVATRHILTLAVIKLH